MLEPPISKLDPIGKGADPCIFFPSSRVPLELPRSFTTRPRASESSLAWWRDARSSERGISQSGSLPMTQGPGPLNGIVLLPEESWMARERDFLFFIVSCLFIRQRPDLDQISRSYHLLSGRDLDQAVRLRESAEQVRSLSRGDLDSIGPALWIGAEAAPQ